MNSINIFFKKRIESRVKRIHRILKNDPLRKEISRGPKQEIFDNFTKFLAAFADKGAGNLNIFPLSVSSKKNRKYSKKIKSKLLRIKNYLHLSKNPTSCPVE